MKAALFYAYRAVGDVLLIVIDPEAKPDRIDRHENVVALYREDRLVGVNIFAFSEVVKVKGEGLLLLPPDPLLAVINHMLINAGLPTLDPIPNSGFAIGRVLTCEEHPDSDHLHVCRVDIGTDHPLSIVCGAPNCASGITTVVALAGTTMFDGSVIVPSSLRGIASEGMLCSPRELHLDNAPAVRGLIILDESAPVGADFFRYLGGQ